MSKQAFKRVRRHLGMEVNRKPLDAYAWPGGYPLYYLFSDGALCCPACANREIDLIDQNMRSERRSNWALVAVEINYEDTGMICDHCGKDIKCAYTIDEESNHAS